MNTSHIFTNGSGECRKEPNGVFGGKSKRASVAKYGKVIVPSVDSPFGKHDKEKEEEAFDDSSQHMEVNSRINEGIFFIEPIYTNRKKCWLY